jgi:hypothetical protein
MGARKFVGPLPKRPWAAPRSREGTMNTTLRDPTARLLDDLLSRRPKPRRKGSHEDPKGFTLFSDRGRGSFLRDRNSGDRSVLAG